MRVMDSARATGADRTHTHSALYYCQTLNLEHCGSICNYDGAEGPGRAIGGIGSSRLSFLLHCEKYVLPASHK